MLKLKKRHIVAAAIMSLSFLAMGTMNVFGAQTATSTSVCADSDGGENYYTKGAVNSVRGREFIDLCVKDNVIREYWCAEGKEFSSLTTQCPGGNACKDGACVLECKAGQKIGDADGNGYFTKTDSDIVAKIDAGLVSKPTNICCFDADQNGKVDIFDAVTIDEITGKIKTSNGVCLPDLAIEEITVSPSNPVPNKETVITVKGKNIGNMPVVFFKLKANPLVISATFPEFIQQSFSTSPDIQQDYIVEPQGSFSYVFKGYFKKGGTKNLTATIDGFAVLKESNEKNNTLKKKIETAFLCADSDGGEDFYKKGTAKGYDSYTGNISKVATYTDKCVEGVNITGTSTKNIISSVEEFYCETQNDPTGGAGYVTKTSNECLIGCYDGACVKNGNGMIDLDLNKTLLTQKELGKKFILMDLATTTPSVSSSEDSRIDIGIEAIGTLTQNAIEPKQKVRQVYTSVDYEKNGQTYELGMAVYNSVAEAQTEYKNNVDTEVALEKWEKFGDDIFCAKPQIFHETSVKTHSVILCGFRVKNAVALMMFSNRLDRKYSTVLSALKQYYNKLVKEMGKEQKISKVKGESVEKPYAKYLSNMAGDTQKLSDGAQERLRRFILDGTNEDTKLLGEGERTAVVFSYKEAYDKLPETDEEFLDLVKIASGRWPSALSKNAETKAREQFKNIFHREADDNNSNDRAAIVIMAYGLRQKNKNRNVAKERNGINIFKDIYGYNPNVTTDWNIVQAISYSGAAK